MPLTFTSKSSPVYGGRRPTWREQMLPNTWAEIPGNTLADIDPARDPAFNPNHPTTAPWEFSGQDRVIGAWCGACFDPSTDILWIPLSGGHSDYMGNEPYKVNIAAESCEWEMLRPPSGAIGNEGVLNDGGEGTGIYFDGRYRAIHSYNKQVYVPGVGPLVAVQGTTAYSAQDGTGKTLVLNEETGEMTSPAENPDWAHSSGSATAYDPDRHRVWWMGAGTTTMKYLDLATYTWHSVGTTRSLSGNTAMVYHNNYLIIFKNSSVGTISNVIVYDCVNEAWVDVFTVSGSPVGTTISGNCQPVVVGSRMYWWDNDTNTTVINYLDIPADPTTGVFTVGQLPVAAENTVTPTVAESNGTYGRFFYSERLGGFGVINAVDQPIYFFAVD